MKKYVFKSYSKNFPELYQKEKERIVSNLKVPLVIEHIGSTAIPGLGGKGIIDIGIATDKKKMELISNKLQALGYEFRPNFSTADRLYFIAYLPDQEEGTRRYHIHLTYPENAEWRDFLDFRDYLKANPEALQQYAKLKQHAVSEAKDEGEKYRKIKDPLLKKIKAKIQAIHNPIHLLIREAKVEDADEIVEAERAIAEEPGYFCSEPSELTVENVINSITAFKGNGLYLVAESDGKLVGHAFLEPQHLQSLRHVADLNIAVHLGWHNKGIGTKLLKQIIERAKESKTLKKIQLNVRASNLAAISLYKKMGFEEEGRLKNRVKVKNGYVDDIIMGLNLVKAPQKDSLIRIRIMEENDMEALVNQFCFPWSSIQATSEKWRRYASEHQEGTRTIYLLEKEKQMIGYASLLYVSEYQNFKSAGIPEINDVWIAEEWRNKGFGKMLIRYIEDAAHKMGFEQIGIGVGLYADYGPAQRLYFHLEYVPDGYGVTYQYRPVVPGESYPLDDELILWLKKDL